MQAVPLSQIRVDFPVLKNPANHHKAVGFTYEQCTTRSPTRFPEEESRRALRALRRPRSGRILWDSVLANLEPGPAGHLVDFRNDDRAAAAVHLRQRTT